MFLVMGVLAALLEARSSGQGQVVDAAIVDGTASLMTMVWSAFEGGWWQDRRGVNLLDGGAPYYDVYATRRRRLAGGRLAGAAVLRRHGRRAWAWTPKRPRPSATTPSAGPSCAPASPRRSRRAPGTPGPSTSPRTDACVAPVLSMAEAPPAPPPRAPAAPTSTWAASPSRPPRPRFSRTPGAIQRPPAARGTDTREALEDWGVPDVDALLASGAAVQA